MSPRNKIGNHPYWFTRKRQIKVLLFAVIILAVRSSIADWGLIPSSSMTPTMMVGDIVWNDKLAYDIRIPFTELKFSHEHPQRGEIVIFETQDQQQILVKRVIGLPGDRVSLHDGILHLNGAPIHYQELPKEDFSSVSDTYFQTAQFWEEGLENGAHHVMFTGAAPRILGNMPEVVVPQDSYFMLGDNRDHSHDSRMYGFIHRDQILGRTTRVLMSFEENNGFQLRNQRFLQELQ